MKFYFDLNNVHNRLAAEVGKAICNTFPIGVDPKVDAYREHPGIKRLDALIEANMTDNKNFNKPWKEFLAFLKKKSKKKISDRSMAIEHAFTGQLLLERYQDDALIRDKKIVFTISMVGDFFTVYGVDETGIKDGQFTYWACNVVTVSPFKEFEPHFIFLVDEIQKQYPTHQFVPFSMTTGVVEGLKLHWGGNNERTVYNALFNDRFDFLSTQFLRGDQEFGWGKSNIEITLSSPPPL